MSTHPEPLALRIRDATTLCGLGKTKIYSLAKQGRLKLVRIDGRTLVPMAELRRLVSEASRDKKPKGGKPGDAASSSEPTR